MHPRPLAHIALFVVNLIYGVNYVVAKGLMPDVIGPCGLHPAAGDRCGAALLGLRARLPAEACGLAGHRAVGAVRGLRRGA